MRGLFFYLTIYVIGVGVSVLAQADPFLSGGVLGASCPTVPGGCIPLDPAAAISGPRIDPLAADAAAVVVGQSPRKYSNTREEEIAKIARQAIRLCLVMARSGVSPNSVLDACAGARNDEKIHESEAAVYADKVLHGEKVTLNDREVEMKGLLSQLNLSDHPLSDELTSHLKLEVESLKESSHQESRNNVMARLKQDLKNGREACGVATQAEHREALGRYDRKDHEVSPSEEAARQLSNCREMLKNLRQRPPRSGKLRPEDQELIGILEATPRFMGRVRGLTLYENLNEINDVDLHYMALHAFDSLKQRIDVLKKQSLSDSALQALSKNDPDFANHLACQSGRKVNPLPEIRNNLKAGQEFKQKLIDTFVKPKWKKPGEEVSEAGALAQRLDDKTRKDLTAHIGAGQFDEAVTLYESKTKGHLGLREAIETSMAGKAYAINQIQIARNSGEGANESHIVTLPNGVKGIFKPFPAPVPGESPRMRENFRGEKAAHHIDKVLGLGVVPVSVNLTIEGREGSFQIFATHAVTPANVDVSQKVKMGEGIAHKPWQVMLLDLTTLNFDRQKNLNNIMHRVPSGGNNNNNNDRGEKSSPVTARAIDNGMGFNSGVDLPFMQLDGASSPFLPPDQEGRQELARRILQLKVQINSMDLHDDSKVNECARMVEHEVLNTILYMIKNCEDKKSVDCNNLGAKEYTRRTKTSAFVDNYYNKGNCQKKPRNL